MKLKPIKELSAMLKKMELRKPVGEEGFEFKPTRFLTHPLLQSIYNLAEPRMNFQLAREKLFFDDGGHVSLDWAPQAEGKVDPPILFIMHGLTGGSEMNYIRVLMSEAMQEGFQCVCLNSRGINNEMTSPVPFTATSFHELNEALDRVQTHYPSSKVFLVGTSFGGNYLIRYLLQHQRPSIKGLIALAPPLSVGRVVTDMPFIYQKFFVKRYIHDTVAKHPQMQYWQHIGLVDMAQVLKSNTLHEFHGSITAKILGYDSADEVFHSYHISGEDIERLGVDTLFMVSKDDPIVSYSSMPTENIQRNPKIKFVATERGGHLCWFTGSIPKRWYPKPALNFLKHLLHK